jgi:hypothetical protein
MWQARSRLFDLKREFALAKGNIQLGGERGLRRWDKPLPQGVGILSPVCINRSEIGCKWLQYVIIHQMIRAKHFVDLISSESHDVKRRVVALPFSL